MNFMHTLRHQETVENFYADVLAVHQKLTIRLREYADMMKKIVDMDEKFEDWGSNDLNNKEM